MKTTARRRNRVESLWSIPDSLNDPDEGRRRTPANADRST
jgi:hypothetical protein